MKPHELRTELRNPAYFILNVCPWCSLEPPTGNTPVLVLNLDCRAKVMTVQYGVTAHMSLA